ncbi:MAG: hypothetical protein CMO74_05020 [Verrucomicrobiales bacterium]|nr:hypothetical protein [Verrucomicrobiales bacterium]
MDMSAMSDRIYMLFWIFFFASPLGGADAVQARRGNALYHGAQRCFQEGQWELAANWLKEYHEKFSPGDDDPDRRSTAIRLRAQALFQLGKYRECFNVLKNAEGAAGLQAAQYRFWMAECRYREAEAVTGSEALYRVAAELYAKSRETKSDRLVDALVSEAVAHARLEDWPRVMELLRPEDGPFLKHVAEIPDSTLAVQGRLILSEAQLRQGLSEDALKTLQTMDNDKLPEMDLWRGKLLEARACLEDGSHEKGLNIVEELLRTAGNRMPVRHEAEALLQQVHLRKMVGKYSEALETCRRLWQENMPASYRRRAVLMALELAVRDHAVVDHAEISSLVDSLLTGEAYAAAKCALGDLCLGKDLRNDNNEQARVHFVDAMEQGFSRAGRMGIAWSFWQDGKFAESRVNFSQAAELEAGGVHLRSRFKEMESAFRMGDHQAVLTLGNGMVTNGQSGQFLSRAKFMMLQSAAITGAPDERVMGLINDPAEFNDPALAMKAQIFLARAQSANGNNAGAFARLQAQAANSGDDALAQWEIARLLARKNEWDKAIASYEAWLVKYAETQSVERVAKLTFDLGWLHHLDGNMEKALGVFTNIVVRYPESSQAPMAQMWVADHFFNQPRRQLVKAEEAYQKVQSMKNCRPQLRLRATLMAGRSALERRNFDSARDYFLKVINAPEFKEAEFPRQLQIEAAFALSDGAIAATARSAEKFDEAIQNLEALTPADGEAVSLIVLQAWGRIADSHLQMAAEDFGRYRKAMGYYRRVYDASGSLNFDPPVRWRAMLGMAHVLKSMREDDGQKRRANLIEALGWTKKVFENAGGAHVLADSFWIRQSGLMSVDLQLMLGDPAAAVTTCRALAAKYISMKPAMDKRVSGILRMQKGVDAP